MISTNNNQMEMQTITDLPPSYEQVVESINIEIEIKEAIEACDVVLKHLGNANKQLSDAIQLGTYDIFFSDILLSSGKFKKVEKANIHLKAANSALKNLNKELVDVKKVDPVKFSDFLVVTDIFFDNIFSDLESQSKIAEAESKCKKAIREIKTIKNELIKLLENQQNPTSDVLSKNEIKEDQETLIREFLDLAKPTVEVLRKASSAINKAKYSVGIEPADRTLSYLVSDHKAYKANEKMIKAILELKKLDKILKKIEGINPKDVDEIPKFFEYAQDIIDNPSIIYYKYALNKYMKAGDSCIGSVIQIEALCKVFKEKENPKKK